MHTHMGYGTSLKIKLYYSINRGALDIPITPSTVHLTIHNDYVRQETESLSSMSKIIPQLVLYCRHIPKKIHWRCHTPVCMVMYLMLCIIIEFIGAGKLGMYSLACLGPETHPVFDGAFSFGLSTYSSHYRPSNRLFTFCVKEKLG